MSLFTQDTPPVERSRNRLAFFALGAVALALIGALVAYLWLRPPNLAPAARRQPAQVPAARPQSAATGALDIAADVPGATVTLDGATLGPAPRLIEGLRAGAHHLRVEHAGYQPWEQDTHVVPGVTAKVRARLSRPPGRLRVESDIAGASVFLDQKFIGRTPLDLPDVALGSHELRVSAEGYDMHTETVDVAPESSTISVRFKEIRLAETLDVVHRHSLGSCTGRLVASGTLLRYETTTAKDAFEVALSSVERTEIDYIGKGLAVRMRRGRTYNFTVKGDNADPLLVFQQKVEKARQRLAGAAS
jgi:hypothetical protein